MPYADREQQRRYQREWMAARRMEWIKANGPCKWCESWDELDVDHRDPATKVSHRVWSWSAERREIELAKCQALCRVCHDRKCELEGSGGRMIRHGIVRWEKGCRCDICHGARTKKSERKREARELRRRQGLPWS